MKMKIGWRSLSNQHHLQAFPQRQSNFKLLFFLVYHYLFPSPFFLFFLCFQDFILLFLFQTLCFTHFNPFSLIYYMNLRYLLCWTLFHLFLSRYPYGLFYRLLVKEFFHIFLRIVASGSLGLLVWKRERHECTLQKFY